MKKYFIQINGQQSQPMSLEQLKAQNITKTTMVWFEGLPNWQEAGTISDLADIITITPPPIFHIETPSHLPEVDKKDSFLFANRNKILLVSISFTLVIILFFSFADKGKEDLRRKTIENSNIIDQQQKMLEEQNAKIVEGERLERRRQEKEHVDNIKKSIEQLSRNLTSAYNELEVAKIKLNDATAFQLLRSSTERNQQINDANENVKYWENEVADIQSKIEDFTKQLTVEGL